MKTLYIILGVALILSGGYGIFLAVPTVDLEEFIMIVVSGIVMTIGGMVIAKGLRKDRREFTRGFQG